VIGDYKEFALELSYRVAYYRKKRNMSQQKLGNLIKCTIKQIKELECDDVSENVCIEAWGNKRINFIFKIAQTLQLDPSIFIVPMSDDSFARYRTDKERLN
jgi:transcriptional regulator with XRE-family HTH domain